MSANPVSESGSPEAAREAGPPSVSTPAPPAPRRTQKTAAKKTPSPQPGESDDLDLEKRRKRLIDQYGDRLEEFRSPEIGLRLSDYQLGLLRASVIGCSPGERATVRGLLSLLEKSFDPSED
jgi:hypothetical protein